MKALRFMLLVGAACSLYVGCGAPLPPLPRIVVVWPDEPAPVDVDPSPMPGDGLNVLIVEETADRGNLPSGQLAVLMSATVRQWLKDNGAEFRVWDADVDVQHESEPFKSAIKLPRDSLPWIYVGNGKTGYSGPLPSTVDEALKLLEKYK